jgi:hypothetical protein
MAKNEQLANDNTSAGVLAIKIQHQWVLSRSQLIDPVMQHNKIMTIPTATAKLTCMMGIKKNKRKSLDQARQTNMRES